MRWPGGSRATIDHDPAADRYRDEIIKRWGPRAVVSLAFAMVASRIYPTVKYAMGHGKARTRIVVGGAPDLSVALLLALDRLSPLERAAFLLHDVFDYSFTQVADTLGRNEAACRQLASRARTRVRDARPAGAIPTRAGSRSIDAKHAELVSAFITASRAMR